MLTDDDKLWISQQIDAQEQRLKEHAEDVETRILRAFQKWAPPFEARVRGHTSTLLALELDVADLKQRIEKLEPPH